MTDMETERHSPGEDMMCPSSVVIKSEPLNDCLGDGSVFQLVGSQYQHTGTNSVMTQQDVENESTTPGLHSAMEEHQVFQQSTNVPIKQEPPEADWKSVKSEDGQIPEMYGYIPHANNEIHLTQADIRDDTEMYMSMTTGKINVNLDQVDSVKYEGPEIQCPSPDINLKPQIPVALYRHITTGITTAENKNMGTGNLESVLPAAKIYLGTQVDETLTHGPAGEKACNNYGCTREATHEISMKESTNEKPFKCSLCDYRASSNSHVVTHMRAHTGETPFKCSVCDYRTLRHSTLVTHIRTHTGEKPFKCTVCDYKFVSNCNLVKHMRTHNGEKPFKCSLCNYRSIQKNTLVRHMRTHTGEKPFNCSHCDYRSIRNSQLLDHMRTHTGEKPFKCSICDYRTAQNSNLVTHMRTHTGEKPFKCSLCDYRSAKSSNLYTHMRTHSGETPDGPSM